MPDSGLDIAADIATLAVARLARILGLDAAALAPVRALVELDIKQRYGRDKVYVRESPPPDKSAAVLRDYHAGTSSADLRRRHGISRATLYRYLKRTA